VSYPERGIQGVNYKFGVLWDASGDNKKAGRYPLARQALLSLCSADPGLGHRRAQVEGKTLKARARASACVLLWTPSLP